MSEPALLWFVLCVVIVVAVVVVSAERPDVLPEWDHVRRHAAARLAGLGRGDVMRAQRRNSKHPQ